MRNVKTTVVATAVGLAFGTWTAIGMAEGSYGESDMGSQKSGASSQEGAAGSSSTAANTEDRRITAKVKEAVMQDPSIQSASDIKVDTNNGIVQLSGFVSSKEEIDKAAEVASQVDGVNGVRNDLTVKSGEGQSSPSGQSGQSGSSMEGSSQ